MDRKTYRMLAKNLPLVTQFGFMLVTPLVLSLWAGLFLQRRFNLGSWVMLVAILIGLLGMFSGFLNFVRYVEKQTQEDEED